MSGPQQAGRGVGVSLKEAADFLSAEFVRLGLDGMQEFAGLTPRSLGWAVKRGELTYISGTQTLEPDALRRYGHHLAKEVWAGCAYQVSCEPHNYPTHEAYLAACQATAAEMTETGLFTEAEVAGFTRPFTAPRTDAPA